MSPLGPTRPPTHRGLSFEKMAKLAAEIEEVADGGVVTAEALDDLAADLGAGVEAIYAALATTELRIETDSDVRFEVCAGGCQNWGALPVLERLVDSRNDRLENGAQAFDVVPRECLDTCRQAAAVVVVSPAGRGVIEAATPAKIDEAIAALLD